MSAVRSGYTDSRLLEIGDEIPQAGGDAPTTLLVHGIAAWTINSIDQDGILNCSPSRPSS
jgi:hypothetical protein